MLSNTIPPNSINLLHRWRVMEAVSAGGIRTRHACGQNPAASYGISTSAIQEFDPAAMTVKTRSGKIYALVGFPDNSPLAEGAWHKWCNDKGIVTELDVTKEYVNVEPAPAISFKKVGNRPVSLQTADLPG